jgi:DNA helicase-2/ATP-dependent DNA helicase PcrA
MSDPFDLADLPDDEPAHEPGPHEQARRAPVAPAPWVAGLNEAQRAAADALDGPVLVLAGAGTGKTRVLTTRLANLIHTRRCMPWQILAVTFTNKAAREMKERVAALIGPGAESLWIGTFHSIATRVLRRHAELVGLKSSFTILDTDDQVRLMKQLLQAEGIDEKRWPPRQLAATIDRWKDKGLTPDKVAAADSGFADGRAPKLYQAYQDRLRTLNACDFGDLLLHNLTLFTQHPDVLREFQSKFRYILVDEYQDTNTSQYLWLRLLSREHKNICCVGDEDQSIYGWRGAEIGNILKFEADFPGAQVVRLEKNYRSTPHILGAASGLIANNQDRLGKTLWTDRNDGDKVSVRGVWDGDEEARFVGDEIEGFQRQSESLNTMAILVRAGFQTRAFEERFITLGLRYRVIGGPRFYERQEIRDALAYFRIVVQPDDDLAFERIVNVPKRGLGEATIQQLHRAARAAGLSLTAATRAIVETDELKPKPRTTLAQLIRDFDRWHGMLEGLGHLDVAETILEESGYTAMWQADRTAEAPGRLENLKELIRALEGFDNLQGFLEHVALVMDNDKGETEDMVSIMTMHAAKGLEFDTVFLPGWEEGIFPSQRSLDEGGLSGLEEERRLAYVGITRARRRCIISHAANRRIYNQWNAAIPSRFLDELPAAHVERQAQGDFYAKGFGSFGGGSTLGGGHGAARQDGTPWLSAERRYAGRTIEAAAKRVDGGEGTSDWGPGIRVFHQKFGYGRVTSVEGEKLTISFDKAGEKKVMAAFVEKA